MVSWSGLKHRPETPPIHPLPPTAESNQSLHILRLHADLWVCLCMHASMDACVHVCLCAYVCLCMCARMCACMYLCMCLCACMHVFVDVHSAHVCLSACVCL